MEFCETFQKLYGKEKYTINIHLHGRLYLGPVYSFWLFAFERLNGILGSYHTNSHDISVQIMRRFCNSQNVGYHSWPEEYKPQFLPLLKHQEYQAGSLQPSSFEQALEVCTSRDIQALPLVVELSWNDSQKQDIRKLITSVIGHDGYDLLTLYNRAPAGGFVLGSGLSRYTHVMAVHPDRPSEIHLAKVEHFCMLNYTTLQISKWVACITFYEVHPCRVWYGGPTEVWCRTRQ